MLSREDNGLLTQVGPGTPMGALFRRFWLPALLSSEVEVDGPPVRLKILGEALVAFRDSTGRVGTVATHCPHKLAPLFFGRNEECGLRCVYHGWKFDADGACVDMPNVSDPRELERMKPRVRITAYPTEDRAGLVWVYMGPAEARPELPRLTWTTVPQPQIHVARWLQRTNWAQGMEGEIDTSHISFLHNFTEVPPEAPDLLRYIGDGAPVITLRETDYGFVYGSRRSYGGQYYWRVTQWMLPMYSDIPGNPDGPDGQGRAWVPIDDHHTMTFGWNYRVDRPYTPAEIADWESGRTFPPRIRGGAVELPDGTIIDAFLPVANKGNDYLMDRSLQKTVSYTGIYGVNEQDRGIQESLPSVPGEPPGIVDRMREHLVSSDMPAVRARRRLLDAARGLQAGIEPAQPHDGDIYTVRAISTLSPIADFDAFMAAHAADWTPAAAPGEAAAADRSN